MTKLHFSISCFLLQRVDPLTLGYQGALLVQSGHPAMPWLELGRQATLYITVMPAHIHIIPLPSESCPCGVQLRSAAAANTQGVWEPIPERDLVGHRSPRLANLCTSDQWKRFWLRFRRQCHWSDAQCGHHSSTPGNKASSVDYCATVLCSPALPKSWGTLVEAVTHAQLKSLH